MSLEEALSEVIRSLCRDAKARYTQQPELNEIELRIKRVTPDGFYRILNATSPTSEVETIDYLTANQSETMRVSVNTLTQETTAIRKIKPRDAIIDNKTHAIRLAFAQEVACGPFANWQSSAEKRQKHRYIWVHSHFEVHLTRVRQSRNNRAHENFELEIELKLESLSNLGELATALSLEVTRLVGLIQNSDRPYTDLRRRELQHLLNKQLNHLDILNPSAGISAVGGSEDYLDHRFYTPARNLKFKDLEDGGIVNNRLVSSIDAQQVRYTGTVKGDGQRCQLIFWESQIWLIRPKYGYNLLATIGSNRLAAYSGYVLDVEEVTPLLNAELYRHHLIPFDLIAIPGVSGEFDTRIQGDTHTNRLALLSKVFAKLNLGNVLRFIFKEFVPLGNDYSSFAAACLRLEHLAASAEYPTDGFMFTPDNIVYNPQTDRAKQHERVLSKLPDICKWKPASELTIDMLLSVEERRAWVRGYEVGSLEEFKGTSRGVFEASTQIQWDHPLIAGLNRVIVELAPQILNGVQTMCPKRLRLEKPEPNRSDIAAQIWNDILEPIQLETLTGVGFQLARKALNAGKSELYAQIASDSNVIEIGAGRGGQFNKWRRFHRILAIEPNSNNIQELQRRTQDFPVPIRIIQAGGQNTAKILEAADEFLNSNHPLCIVSMLSMSFLWESNTTLRDFLTTLSQLSERHLQRYPASRVSFVFQTIEGSLVENYLIGNSGRVSQFMQPTYNVVETLSASFNGVCSLRLSNRRQVQVNIQGTIVDNYIEYLVNLQDLFQLKHHLRSLSAATTSRFMSQDELDWCGLFVNGIIDLEPGIDLQELTLRLSEMQVAEIPQRKTSPPSNAVSPRPKVVVKVSPRPKVVVDQATKIAQPSIKTSIKSSPKVKVSSPALRTIKPSPVLAAINKPVSITPKVVVKPPLNNVKVVLSPVIKPVPKPVLNVDTVPSVIKSVTKPVVKLAPKPVLNVVKVKVSSPTVKIVAVTPKPTTVEQPVEEEPKKISPVAKSVIRVLKSKSPTAVTVTQPTLQRSSSDERKKLVSFGGKALSPSSSRSSEINPTLAQMIGTSPRDRNASNLSATWLSQTRTANSYSGIAIGTNGPIWLRHRGLADFLNKIGVGPVEENKAYRRWHEVNGKTLAESTLSDLPSYHQEVFGYAADGNRPIGLEFMSLGAMVAQDRNKANNVLSTQKHRTLASLLGGILTCISPTYQELELQNGEGKRYEMIEEIFDDIVAALRAPGTTSEVAAKLNPLVKGWMPFNGLVTLCLAWYSKFEAESILAREEYRSIDLLDEPNPGWIPLIENVQRELTRKEIDAALPGLQSRLQFNVIPSAIQKSTVYYLRWNGPIVETPSCEDYFREINNEILHRWLLEVDGIDTNSLFYNYRGGYMFRFYHRQLKTLEDVEKLSIHSNFSDLWQIGFIADAFQINVKVFAMPDKPDESHNFTATTTELPERPYALKQFTKRSNQPVISSLLESRIAVNVAPEFSFYPTATSDGVTDPHFRELYAFWKKAVIGNAELPINPHTRTPYSNQIFHKSEAIGNPEWCNVRSPGRNLPTVYLYVHRYDSYYKVGKFDGDWYDVDLHNEDLNPSNISPLQLIYVPLGQVVDAQGTIRTLFSN